MSECAVDDVEQVAVRARSRGMELFELAFRLLDMFDQQRTPDQKRFHDAIFQTCAAHIFKDDFLQHREELLDRFDWDEFKMAAMIMTPRRSGKTTAAAMACAVLLYVGRGMELLVFSSGQEMSSTFMQKVKAYFLQLPNAHERILRNDVKRFSVAHIDAPAGLSAEQLFAGKHVNTLLARAATVNGNKGVSADVFFLEEAALIPQSILGEVIAPMLKVSNSALVMLSTRRGPENYFDKLFARDDDASRRLFSRLQMQSLQSS